MADDGVEGATPRHPRRSLMIVLGLAVVLAGCGVAAQALLSLQHSYQGTTGGRVAHLIASGSTWATSWPGWLAAIFFGIAALRVRRGAPEPPAGLASLESMSLTEMRRGLVREYTVVRVALALVALVALVDAARAARYVVASLSGDSLARATLPALIVESLGLVVAAVMLGLWARSFRAQLERVGALG